MEEETAQSEEGENYDSSRESRGASEVIVQDEEDGDHSDDDFAVWERRINAFVKGRDGERERACERKRETDKKRQI